MTERPAIIRISENVDGEDARVMITLAWGDMAFHGEAIGSSGNEHRARLVGEATLNAVEKVTEGRIHLDLEAVATQDLGIVQVALAQVNLTDTGESLVGSALVSEHDPSAATVKAILDAINRRLASVL
jgi:hypothetical protein